VKPLLGYPGEDDHAVVIPYNHVWLEGDANDRRKSQDSNVYGPISQNMIYGFVIGVWRPLFTWPVWFEHDADERRDYPAKKSGRLEKDAVRSAKLHPDDEARITANPFENGQAAVELAMMRKHVDQMPAKMRDKRMLRNLRTMYSQAQTEFRRGNPKTKEVAAGLIEELEIGFESVGLNKNGTRMVATTR